NIDQIRLAQHVGLADHFVGGVQTWQVVGGCRLVDQWRGHLARQVPRVPPDAEPEQGQQQQEDDEWLQTADAAHAVASASLPSVGDGSGGAAATVVYATRLRARKRLSAAAVKPPSIISTPPPQIQRTNGL